MRDSFKSGFILLTGMLASAMAFAEPDWSKIPGKDIPMFFPGQSGYEWIMSRPDHTGSLKLKEKKQNCYDCHEYDADVIGNDVVEGKKVGKSRTVIDTAVPEGTRGNFPLKVKAAHDETKIYLRFEWESPAAATGAKSDPDNEVKLSLMFGGDSTEGVNMSGCWMSCHMDLRTMPESSAKAKKHARAKALGWNDGATKYLAVSRSSISEEKKPRGGWDKLRGDKEIKTALEAGNFLDLIQYRSGAGGKSSDGYVLESRHMNGGKSLVGATGAREGNKWIVTFERLLAGGAPGDHTIKPGQALTFGVSIHENYRNARFHHVSLGYTLGIDNGETFIKSAVLPTGK